MSNFYPETVAEFSWNCTIIKIVFSVVSLQNSVTVSQLNVKSKTLMEFLLIHIRSGLASSIKL